VAARIAAVDLPSSPSLDALVTKLRALGAEAFPIHADLATVERTRPRGGGRGDALRRPRRRREQRGVNRPGPLVEYAVEDWDRMFAVNTRATWLLAKAAYPARKASRRHRGHRVDVG
jgi:glucose 1-dehydrogenase